MRSKRNPEIEPGCTDAGSEYNGGMRSYPFIIRVGARSSSLLRCPKSSANSRIGEPPGRFHHRSHRSLRIPSDNHGSATSYTVGKRELRKANTNDLGRPCRL